MAELLAALKKGEDRQRKNCRGFQLVLPIACEFETAIGFCENEQKYSVSLPKSGPPSHRQQLAGQTAHDLVEAWLVQRRGIYEAESLSHQSAWLQTVGHPVWRQEHKFAGAYVAVPKRSPTGFSTIANIKRE